MDFAASHVWWYRKVYIDYIVIDIDRYFSGYLVVQNDEHVQFVDGFPVKHHLEGMSRPYLITRGCMYRWYRPFNCIKHHQHERYMGKDQPVWCDNHHYTIVKPLYHSKHLLHMEKHMEKHHHTWCVPNPAQILAISWPRCNDASGPMARTLHLPDLIIWLYP